MIFTKYLIFIQSFALFISPDVHAEYRVEVGTAFDHKPSKNNEIAILTMDQTISIHNYNQKRNFQLKFKSLGEIEQRCLEQSKFKFMLGDAADQQPFYEAEARSIGKWKFEADAPTNKFVDALVKPSTSSRDPNGEVNEFHVELHSEVAECLNDNPMYQSELIFLDVGSFYPMPISNGELFYRVFADLKNGDLGALQETRAKFSDRSDEITQFASRLKFLKQNYKANVGRLKAK